MPLFLRGRSGHKNLGNLWPEKRAQSSKNLSPQVDGSVEAGVSCSLLHACVTALACKPVRALRGTPTPQAA